MSNRPLPEHVLTAESDGDGLSIVRIFDAPREEVFKAWIEPERFAQWFGEHGSTVPVDTATMDVRPGGAWRAVMIVGETHLVFSGHYREVDEPAHLVLTVTDQVPTDEDTVYEVLTVDLEDLGDGRTQMTFTQRGGTMPPEQYEMTLRGWLAFFERQGDLLKARHDSDP